MEINDTTNPVDGEATPNEEAELEIEVEESQEIENPDHADAEEDTEDEEIEGEESEKQPTYKVKVAGEELEVTLEELQNGYSREADYTRKAQALADKNRAFEEQTNAFMGASAEEGQALTEVIALRNEIAKYDDIDWAAEYRNNAQATQAARFEVDQLKDRLGKAEQDYQQANQQRLFQQQQQHARQLEEGRAKLAEVIPGWNDDKAQALAAEAKKEFGLTDEQIRGITDPLEVVILNEAIAYRRSVSKTKSAVTAQAKAGVRPASTVRGSSPAGRNLRTVAKGDGEDAMAEYVKMRERQTQHK